MNQQSYAPIYSIGDTVYYCGSRYRNELIRDSKSLKGTIHARIQGAPDTFCVEFPDAKPNDRDYVLGIKCLTKTPPSREKEKEKDGPEVQVQTRRRQAEDET